MNVLSYNLEKHKAASELEELFIENKVDVACLQEVTVEDLPDSIAGLNLVASTKYNRLGLAIFVSPLYNVIFSIAEKFKKSLHDIIAEPAVERLLAVEVEEEGRTFIIANLHASPLTSLNVKRRKQILTGLSTLKRLGGATPLLMTGDFNYPIFQKHLEKILNDKGYELTLSNNHTYSRAFIKGHFDFVASKDFSVSNVSTLTKGLSDHHPILIDADPLDVEPIHLV